MKLHQALETLGVDNLKQRRALTPSADRSTRKADIVAALAHYLLSEDLRVVWERLSELEIDAIAETVHSWGGYFDRVRFRSRYGAVPSSFNPPVRVWGMRDAERERPSVLPLFFYHGEIPEDLRPRLAELVPPPPELQIASLADEELPASVASDAGDGAAEPLRRIATEPLVRHDLPAVLRLIAQGGIGVGPKTGLPSGAALAKLEPVLLGGDWYAPEDDRGAARWSGGPIRPIRPFAWPLLLQVGGLVKRDGNKLALTPRGNKALSQPIQDVVAHLFHRWQQKGTPDELRRVDLIKGQTSKGARLSAVADRRASIAIALRDCCPEGRWIAIDELFRQMLFRDHSFEISHNPWKLYFSDPGYGSLGYEGYGGFEILQARYILAYLFEYLATLGMIDVAYTLPYGARPNYSDIWGTDELLFLSRYDGLRCIRLNALGAFCLGLATHYRPAREEKPPLFSVGADLGLTLLREPEPAERLLLERIAKPSSADRWSLDPDAILEQGADADERGRVRSFLQDSADGDLPEQVRQLLDTVDERATALLDTGPARLIECKDAAIAAMLASDPATARLCVRAGDRLICVAEPKLAAFRKGLARLGFVLPAPPGG